MWDAQVELLAPTHQVITFDARGHGLSPTPTEPFSHYEDLLELLDHLGVARASLVGLSQGGRTSIDFAIAHPHRVAKIVLAGTGISGMTFRDPFVLSYMKKLSEATDIESVVECFLRMWVDGPQRTPDEVDPAVREPCHAAMSDTITRHGARWLGLLRELGAIDRVAELTARTLVLVGDLDSSDIHTVADLVAGAAPNAHKKVVTGAGHMINLDQPEEFNRVLRRFLAH
ncbi:alpha/beta fold hydrolase [Lentzea tibetensis]|uniref:Alpha/beta fold hydrolase n=2 Tax=Lentzea tibetensis TaxID=2591470 RepID=A0A563EQE7_9PSEU|nr:alpha/beta fold hydrolase [Lentzea tibetensis]